MNFMDPINSPSLRDHFAMAALPGCIIWQQKRGRDELLGDGEPKHAQPHLPGDPDAGDLHAVAEAAYLFADAMLKARAGFNARTPPPDFTAL